MEASQSCVVCAAEITYREPTWNCERCYLQLHLECIREWIEKLNRYDGQGSYYYSCPTCKQAYHTQMPDYYCYCGNTEDPAPSLEHPHSCQQYCAKQLKQCEHICTAPCHPGKCKACAQPVKEKCGCGKFTLEVQCGKRDEFSCGQLCDKPLGCENHSCQQRCHKGNCRTCDVFVTVSCYCQKQSKTNRCVANVKKFLCEEQCSKPLACGKHFCRLGCHPGKCEECPFQPDSDIACPCGRATISAADNPGRKLCTDELVHKRCQLRCSAQLPNCKHVCMSQCHDGPCPPCESTYRTTCRCGSTSQKYRCNDKPTRAKPLRCQTSCTHLNNCGVHKCRLICCDGHDYEQHTCLDFCGKKANCGKHFCGKSCHQGPCADCKVLLTKACPCGKSTKEMVFCSVNVPSCGQICEKLLKCGHNCQKICHEGECECTFTKSSKCRCEKSTIEVGCGEVARCKNLCGAVLGCGHRCMMRCHEGPCTEIIVKCNKACGQTNPNCGHPCKQMCHFGTPCDFGKCQTTVKISCKCGNNEQMVICGEVKWMDCHLGCSDAKRFHTVHEGRGWYYPDEALQFAEKQPTALRHLEEAVEQFIRSSQQQIQLPLSEVRAYREVVRMLLTSDYRLSCRFLSNTSKKSIEVTKTPSTQIPHPALSKYSAPLKDDDPFLAKLEATNISIDLFKDIANWLLNQELRSIPYIVRNGDRVSLLFWEADTALQIKSLLLLQFRRTDWKLTIFSKPVQLPEQQPSCLDKVDQLVYKIDNQHSSRDTSAELIESMRKLKLNVSDQECRLRSTIILSAYGKGAHNQTIRVLFQQLRQSYRQDISMVSQYVLGSNKSLTQIKTDLEDKPYMISSCYPEFAAYQYIVDFLFDQDHAEEFLENVFVTQQMETAMECLTILRKANGMQVYFNLLRQAEFGLACLLVCLYDNVVQRIIRKVAGQPVHPKQLLRMFKLRTLEELQPLLSAHGFNLSQTAKHVLIEQQPAPTSHVYCAHEQLIRDILNDKRKKGQYSSEPDEYLQDMYPLSYFAFGDHLAQRTSFVSDTLRRLKNGITP